MDVTELSADELRRLADEKAGEEERVFEVEGLTVRAYPAKCKSWKAVRIMSNVSGEFDIQAVQAMLDFVGLVTDVDEDAIVAHCGGDAASFEDVVRVVSLIVKECYPKN